MNIYLIKEENNRRYKIGVSKHPEKRLLEVQTSNSNKVILVDVIPVKNPWKVETMIHLKCREYSTQGEWFELPDDVLETFEQTIKTIDNNLNALKESNSYIQEQKKLW